VRIVLRGAAESSAMFTCDGQTTETISSGDSVEVSRAPMPLRLIHPKNYNYFQILRNKLHWGRKPDTT
jgi:NAD+ kinase